MYRSALQLESSCWTANVFVEQADNNIVKMLGWLLPKEPRSAFIVAMASCFKNLQFVCGEHLHFPG